MRPAGTLARMTELDQYSVYGRWAGLTPADAAAFMSDYPRPWFIAGGYCIEALTGPLRAHSDMDFGVLTGDHKIFADYCAGRYHVWSAANGALKPWLPGQPDSALLPGSNQFWLRRDSESLWEFDVLLNNGNQEWVCKRNPDVTLPWQEALWEVNGIWFLRPEVQLLMKAKHVRAKDQEDFDAAVPLLEPTKRTWLKNAVAIVHPNHAWLDDLD